MLTAGASCLQKEIGGHARLTAQTRHSLPLAGLVSQIGL